jgi:methylamine dehydrogenase accessory protein MauD
MIDALVVSQIVLWVVVIALAATCLALLRQVGVLHERTTPFGAMMSDRGPDVGDAAPVMDTREMSGREIRIGGPSAADVSTLLLFVASTCPVCKRLLPVAKRFAHEEGLSLILVGDGDPESYQHLIKDHGLHDLPLLNSPGIGMRFHVGKLPYAVLIDGSGVICSKGLVNTREHLESLIVAQEMGLRSIDQYFDRRRKESEKTAADV